MTPYRDAISAIKIFFILFFQSGPEPWEKGLNGHRLHGCGHNEKPWPFIHSPGRLDQRFRRYGGLKKWPYSTRAMKLNAMVVFSRERSLQ